jgi:hypothetical protein
MTAALFYGDDNEYAVELGDRVEVRIEIEYWGGQRRTGTFNGEIRHIHPRSTEVTVRYEDYEDTTRAGAPRKKTRRVAIADIDLTGRDG